MTKRVPQPRIVNTGMGGFLNPPGHPDHNYSVEYDRRRGVYHSCSSLSSVRGERHIPVEVRAQARSLIKRWEAENASTTPDPEWVLQVLGYFRGCYRNDNAPAGQEWHATHTTIDQDRDPMLNAHNHTGVNFVRKFYPGFQPTAEMFAGAYWGSKK